MAISDQLFDALLILVWLGTPLMFAASLFLQAENRSSCLTLPKLSILPRFEPMEDPLEKAARENSQAKQNKAASPDRSRYRLPSESRSVLAASTKLHGLQAANRNNIGVPVLSTNPLSNHSH